VPAISGLALVALTVPFARSFAGAGVALLAGCILATCFGFLGHHAVRSGDLDAPLALILFPIVYLGPRLPAARWARLALGLLMGLAFLLKSFAFLPFVAARPGHSSFWPRWCWRVVARGNCLDRRQWLLVWCCALTPVLLFTIVRTHHSWYIVPTYAAWALLGAASVVDLYRGFRLNEGGRLLVGAAAVIGLLGCEARIVLALAERTTASNRQ
jgi:hypothetical protein